MSEEAEATLGGASPRDSPLIGSLGAVGESNLDIASPLPAHKYRRRTVAVQRRSRRLFLNTPVENTPYSSSLFGRSSKSRANFPVSEPLPEPAASPKDTAPDSPAPEENSSQRTIAPMPAEKSKPTLTFSFEAHGAKRLPRAPQEPFVVSVLGDFSGRASRSIVEPIGNRRPLAIDVDNLEGILARLAPSVLLPDPGQPEVSLELSFSELDDFHPDQLVEKLPSLVRLRALRPQLMNTATSAKAAKQLQSLLSVSLPKASRRPSAPATASESDAQTMERLLGRGPVSEPVKGSAPASTAHNAVQALIQQALSGSVVQNPSAHQKELVSALDAACAEHLRAVLTHPHFQALESAWRTVERLVQSFDEADGVKLLLIDISKEELARDLADVEDVTGSGLYKLLYDATTEQPWVFGVALHSFGESAEDLAVAGKLALAGGYLSTPFVAAAHPNLIGIDNLATQSDPDTWAPMAGTAINLALSALRQKPEAAFLSLTFPRFLLRQPYGKNSDPFDLFPFEEVPVPDAHEDYLWGNAAGAVAQLLIERFKREGWGLPPSTGGDLGAIPAHHYKQDGESLVKPGAEVWLGERAAFALQQQGITPVLSVKNRDAVRIVRIDSLAAPTQPLALRLS
jgi:type VI secretion system ImpC/EvpB family protein/type VI secretion system ImpB/VipA family protein